MTPTEALARIAALCGGFQADGHGDAVSITAVRAVLAEVTPEPGGITESNGWTARDWENWSNDVAAELPEDYDGDEDQETLILRFVQHAAQAPAGGTFDRDQAYRVLADVARRGYLGDALDRLAACVRPATLDCDQARAVLLELLQSVTGNDHRSWPLWTELDRLAACVRPATIDRDALLQAVHSMRHSRGIYDTEMADRILALVRPVAGVVLSREEAARIVRWYTLLPIGVSADDVELAGRLKEVAP